MPPDNAVLRLAEAERHRAELALDAHWFTCPVWPAEACEQCRELAEQALAAARKVWRQP